MFRIKHLQAGLLLFFVSSVFYAGQKWQQQSKAAKAEEALSLVQIPLPTPNKTACL
jgi:hypothetical protein